MAGGANNAPSGGTNPDTGGENSPSGCAPWLGNAGKKIPFSKLDPEGAEGENSSLELSGIPYCL